MNVLVLGAGAWGTAMALAAVAAGHQVVLWARSAEQALRMQYSRDNQRYLPGVALPRALMVTSDLRQALAHADVGLTLIATPMAGLREALHSLPAGRSALWLCKGLEAGSGALAHEVARALRPDAACGVLSGPSFALEVAQGLPTALVAASESAELSAAAVLAFHSGALRVYTTTDGVGVEVGGAVKNVLAIATGIVDGMAGAGLNARAALVTRGLAEMTRLGLALGARAETFMGLSGLGDLVLTATGNLSRNRQVGLGLASGKTLHQTLTDLGHVAEGALAAPVVLSRARQLGVDMPITAAVVEVLEGRLAPAQAMAALMARHARAEEILP